MSDRPIAAVILAAGYASRMGRFKPLLPLGDRKVIDQVVSLYQRHGVAEIIVVTGHRADELADRLAPMGVRPVFNPAHKAGMFSSVTTGVSRLSGSARAAFVHPADIPLVRPATIQALMARCPEAMPYGGRGRIAYPTFAGRRGHPPLISTDILKGVPDWSGEMGLRGYLETHADAAVDVPVPDAGILMDIDTPADYAAVLDRLDAATVPTPDEAAQMMAIADAPEPVIRHCRVVAAVAVTLADAAVAAGIPIDPRLVSAAAGVHDIARARAGRDHANAGAAIMEEWGFPEVADIVRVHIDIAPDRTGPLTEAEIVYLADKCVEGDRIVDPAARFARKAAAYGDNPAAAEAIERRRDAARTIAEKLTAATGRAMADLLITINPLPDKGEGG